jgi:hypothetical protein
MTAKVAMFKAVFNILQGRPESERVAFTELWYLQQLLRSAGCLSSSAHKAGSTNNAILAALCVGQSCYSGITAADPVESGPFLSVLDSS